MTTPPLPDTPCVRVRLDYQQSDTFLAGSRFYLSYSGSAPTAANCSTLATDVANSWESRLAGNVSNSYGLIGVDVLDIATIAGASATVVVAHGGTQSGDPPGANVAQNIEYKIARRYRGGKPRMYLPPATADNLEDGGHWTDSQVSNLQTGIGQFFSDLEALSIGSMGTLAHINLSYYSMFKNLENSSGRMRAVPQYKAVATHDIVTGYSVKKVVSSQRRRRTATTA